MALDFRILGPLEVAEDGVVLRLGGRMQRAVLAVLLLDAGRVVPVERLVDDLYGEDAPATGAAQVRDHVSQLRKLLKQDGARIETQAPGYVLRLEPSQLDAERFEQAVDAAAAALADGRPDDAALALRDALTLWRGPALADFVADDFAQPAIGRLEELRLVALERRIAAELAAGADGALVPELQALVGSHPLRERLRGLMMLALYRAGRQAEAVEAYHETRRILGEELGIEPSTELRELLTQILRQDPSLARNGGTATPAVDLRNPYKGLRPFLEADADDFFGRESLTTRLVERAATDRFVAVIGPSGSGKSSVVRAGVVPVLRADSLRVVEITPGAYPLEELEAALLRIAENPPASLLEQLGHDERGLLRAVKRVLPGDASELLLVLDQLEELFTLVGDERVREHFLASIECAVRDPHSRMRVVATLRADFYDRPLQYRGFAELVRDGAEVVLPLSPDELERAIAAPARQVGLHLEEGLLAEIVADVVDEPSALPLLQYALTELVEQRDGDLLTRAAYGAIGGISGALAGSAESVYGRLDDSGREAARQLFLRLVAVGSGAITRRRVEQRELDSLDGVSAVIDQFGGARLLSFDRDPRTGEATVELAHEALLGAWERLRSWADGARDDVRLHRRLGIAAVEWDDADRDGSFLLRGSQLARFEAWAETSIIARTELEDAFLGASLAERERELERERRSFVRLRALVVVLAVAVAAAVALTVLAFVQSGHSKHEARIANAQRLAAASAANLAFDPELSILLALRAVETNPALPETIDALHHAVAATRIVRSIPGAGSKAVAYSPDGSRVAVAGPRGVAVWNVATGRRVLAIAAPGAHDVAYSPDGSLLATRSDDGSVGIWNANTGRRHVRLPGAHVSGTWAGLAFSPDGRLLAADNYTDGVEVWDVRRARVVRTLHSAAALCGVAWSPVGGDIATGDCGSYYSLARARVWNVGTGRRVVAVGKDANAIISVAFSPDGSRVASASLGGNAYVADARTGAALLTLRGNMGEVAAVAYSRNGRLIATASSDGTARVWDSADGRELLTLQAGSAAVTGVAFAPDGTRLATVSADGTARIWDTTTAGSREWLTIAAHPGGVESLLYSDDGRQLSSTGFDDRHQRVWDARTGRLLGSYKVDTFPDVLQYGAITADSRVRSSLGGTTASGYTLAITITGDTGELVDAAGNMIAALGVGHGGIYAVAFDRTGRRLAVGNRDGTLIVYGVPSGHVESTIASGQGIVDSVAFSPDGTTLATGGQDTTTKLWDTKTAGELFTLTGQRSSVSALAFDPTGTFLATGSLDGTIRVYVLRLDKLIAVARARLTRGWTAAECAKYLGGACPARP
jgi:WD40 repeat protein/DNA-binding SARP family transcriptional activator